jgi:hypothetical protein
MSLISPERQYAINYEISREAPQEPGGTAPAAAKKGIKPTEPSKKLLSDEVVTIRAALGSYIEKPQVSVQHYQGTVGQDSAFLEATLRNKLAEYGLRAHTRIDLSRDNQGEMQIQANAPQSTLNQIRADLNHNQEFRSAFSRLSQNQPTLDYVANVSKLNNAYGADNSLFNSLVSSRNDNNSLSDIAHRYDKLKQTMSAEPISGLGHAAPGAAYRFSLNA